MSGKKNTMEKIKKNYKQATKNTSMTPIIKIMAQFGYAARGFIYFVMGLLSILLAFANGGQTTDQQGAIAAIGRQPEGRILLWLILIGLICYSFWGLFRVVFNPYEKENDVKGGAVRVGYLFKAIVYASLALTTYALITGGAKPALNGAQGVKTQSYVSEVLTMPGGQWLVGIGGILVILLGLSQAYKGIMPNFEPQHHLVKLTLSQVKCVECLGRLGTIARGIIFDLVGIFLMIAAYTADSKQAKGLDGTLMSLLQQPYGRWLMGSIALGLIALGIYYLIVAIFFRFEK